MNRIYVDIDNCWSVDILLKQKCSVYATPLMDSMDYLAHLKSRIRSYVNINFYPSIFVLISSS